MAEPAQSESRVEVTEKDLPLHCPMPRTPLWCSHPRVFLLPGASGDVRCPYCGTVYVYRGAPLKGH